MFLEIAWQNKQFKISLSLLDFKQLLLDNGDIVHWRENWKEWVQSGWWENAKSSKRKSEQIKERCKTETKHRWAHFQCQSCEDEDGFFERENTEDRNLNQWRRRGGGGQNPDDKWQRGGTLLQKLYTIWSATMWMIWCPVEVWWLKRRTGGWGIARWALVVYWHFFKFDFFIFNFRSTWSLLLQENCLCCWGSNSLWQTKQRTTTSDLVSGEVNETFSWSRPLENYLQALVQ